MISPNMAARTVRIGVLIALCTVAGASGAAEPAGDLAAIITQLQQASSSYSSLVRAINPRYVPGELEGYDEAADRLERLGAQLEQLSRKALRLDQNDLEAIASLGREIQQLQEAITDLRAFSTHLRAYGYLLRNDVNRPRWAFAQVPAECFVEPDVHTFNAHFTDTVELTATAGDAAAFQLIAVPIDHDIRNPRVQMPETLEARNASIGKMRIECGQAATRSSPLADDEREHPACPYRLRDCGPGHTIAKDRLQPYWFIFRVPPDAEPGIYRGEMKFAADDAHDMKLTIKLTIPDGDPESTPE